MRSGGKKMADGETVTVTEAARMLGTTNERITRLIQCGVLTSWQSKLDRRRRLIPRADVEQILREEGWNPPQRRARLELESLSPPLPSTRGMYDGPMKVTSDEVDEYLAKNWQP